MTGSPLTRASLLCAPPITPDAHGGTLPGPTTPEPNKSLTVNDLRSHELIGRTDRKSAWRFRTPGSALHEIEVVPGTVIPEPAVLQTVLIGGAGIGRLPDFCAADAVAAGTLVRLLPECQDAAVDVHALYSSHRSLSAKVRVFIDALATHLNRN